MITASPPPPPTHTNNPKCGASTKPLKKLVNLLLIKIKSMPHYRPVNFQSCLGSVAWKMCTPAPPIHTHRKGPPCSRGREERVEHMLPAGGEAGVGAETLLAGSASGSWRDPAGSARSSGPHPSPGPRPGLPGQPHNSLRNNGVLKGLGSLYPAVPSPSPRQP